MGRDGGAVRKHWRMRSTVNDICTEVVTVQESMWKPLKLHLLWPHFHLEDYMKSLALNTGSTISNPLGLSLMTTSSNDPHSSLPTVTNMTTSDRSTNSVDCVATRAHIYDTPATTATSTSSANMATCASSPATVTTSMSYPTHATCKPSSATLVTSTSTPASLVGATFTVSTITTNIKSTTSN
ncbi:hypothetical protein O6P43_027116 [Quillaja saponaria]|uniref:Uncharacterized protein n=1 Tax=Quillaja saponaria TaxID=32244 RepID=A0AAD7L5E9_QUISA|nr:hypothetical protein O6P43_027116 [Quillaja saponaria]